VSLDDVKAYHMIIEEEARNIAGEQRIEEGKWYPIVNTEYFVQRDQLRNFLKRRGFSNPDVIIDSLINRGFLVRLPESSGSDGSFRLRSLHMDILVRSSQITTQHGRPPYLLSYRFAISKLKVPAEEDRTIIPELGANMLANNLWATLLSFFEGDKQLTEIYINIIKDYLGNSGLDAFQTHALYSMLSSRANTHAIVAPTGSGKTEIYLFYLLASLIRWRILENDLSRKALLVYPRKALTVDQAYRIARLLSKANLYLGRNYGISLTFAIRDGDTPRDQAEVEQGKSFRGVSCPNCGGQLIYNKRRSATIVICERCKAEYKFIKVTRDETPQADIVATNPWALETRLLDSAPSDVNADVLSNVGLIVFDEVHEYAGLSGGILASLIDVIKSINSYERLELIFSSATVPDPKDFTLKLSGDSNCRIYNFREAVTKSNINIAGERLVILGYFAMNPQYSWVTYCQLWTILMAFLSYAYDLRGAWQPQSVLFVNNIKELRRVRSGYIENLRLGEPKDHLREDLNSLDPYCYWHYLPLGQRKNILQLIHSRGIFDKLVEKVVEVHGEISREEREKSVSRLRSGDGLVALSTSSLELGVDYGGVGFILNVGLDNPISLIQRVGRGGRSNKTLRTVLGILLVRALPTEMLKTYDEVFMKALATTSLEGYKLLITRDNPQIIKRRTLIEAIARLAKKHIDTHASRTGIRDLESLRAFIKHILGEIK